LRFAHNNVTVNAPSFHGKFGPGSGHGLQQRFRR
jgi:hypothetical protein